MTNDPSLGLASRPTLRLLGVLGALAIGATAGAQPVRPDSQRAGASRDSSSSSVPRQGGTTSPTSLGGLSGGVLKQGGTTSPTPQGGASGGVLKQEGTAAARPRSRPR